MGNDRSPESKNNVWRHHILQCSKAGDSENEGKSSSLGENIMSLKHENRRK